MRRGEPGEMEDVKVVGWVEGMWGRGGVCGGREGGERMKRVGGAEKCRGDGI